MITYFRIFLLLTILFTSCIDKDPSADIIITNARIWTGNEKQPYAQSIAISGDTILAIGDNSDMLAFKSSATEFVNMDGKFITPGFIDSHVHLMMGGNALLSVELRDANTKEIFISKIAEHVKNLKKGNWILEGNWDHTLWGGELPSKVWIDNYTKENPIALYRLDGHMILANSLALKLAGINKDTPNSKGGEIVKDKYGEPTGILKGHAMNAVLDKIPAMSDIEKEKALLKAQEYLLSNGVTSVHDVDSLGGFSAAKKLYDKGELNLRIYAAKPLNRWNQAFGMEAINNNMLKTGIVKGFVDGSLGSHTAAFKEDYSDKQGDKGFFINSKEHLYDWILNADKENLQITVHAIGDDAINSLLNIYEAIIKENGVKDRRLRIEHVQHIAPDDISRFEKLGVIASVQPYHAIDDGRWAEEVIGSKRIKTTYAFKSLMDAKSTVIFGSDWPVAPASPLKGIYAATTRRTLDDKNPDGWIPEQKISVEQALIAYTKSAAYASFDEDIKGTLEVGKLADFVVLSEDVLKTNPNKIKDIKVLQTYFGGKKVYDVSEEVEE